MTSDPEQRAAAPEPSRHYGSAAIRRSFMHFVLGKGVAAVATLAVLFVLVRRLEVTEFAAYTSLHALALIIGLVSSLGIPQLLHRFLPELRTADNSVAMYRLLLAGIAARAVAYAALCGLLLPLLEQLAGLFKLEDWLPMLPWYFAVGFCRVNATFVAQALESLLWQRDAQYSLAATGITKLAGTLYCLSVDALTLENFIWVELLSELAAIVMLAAFVAVRWARDEQRAEGSAAILRDDRPRYLRFAFWCYLQNLTSIFYGSAPNRLFVAYFMSPQFIAVFGVIDRLIDFARRYEPLRMFVGLIRPVLLSRFSQHGNFGKLAHLANLVLLANYMILLAPLALLIVSGETILGWITDARYGDINSLVIAFYVVLMYTSLNNLIDILVKAVEHNRVYMVTNLLLSGSLLLAVPLVDALGLWSIALANLTGLSLSLALVRRYLRARGFDYRLEWRHMLTLAAVFGGAVLAGLALRAAGLQDWMAGSVTLAVYAIALLRFLPLDAGERGMLREILPARVRHLVPAPTMEN